MSFDVILVQMAARNQKKKNRTFGILIFKEKMANIKFEFK